MLAQQSLRALVWADSRRSPVVITAALAIMALLTPQAPRSSAFDVASIRPSRPEAPPEMKTDPGRLAATGMSLSDLIQQAYGVPALAISGAPLNLGRFDIEGRAAGRHTRGELLEMLKTLLADRFKLTLHRETREMPVEALVRGKSLPKLKPPATPDADPGVRLRVNRQGGGVGSVSIVGTNVTLSSVANYLSGRFQKIVVDGTGLAGAFDFDVSAAIDSQRAADPGVPEREFVADLFKDFVQNLGLKLESQRAAVEILVVDHAEKPDEN